MKRNNLAPSVLTIGFLIASCTSPGNEEKNTAAGTVAAADTTPVNELASFKFSFTIANLPAPLTVLDEFSKSGLPADIGLLNPSENANNYHSSMQQAFNYGIYGVDLGYLVVNNRTIETIKYYSTAKGLAEQLGIAETFNRFVNRFESNADNKDSLSRVIDEAYAATDDYLRSNERLITASEVLAGSWLECQYITVNLLKSTERTADNEKLFQRIWEQRFYLDNITKLLSEFKEDAVLLAIKKDFESLLPVYKEPKDAAGIDKAFLEKLAAELGKVRHKIIG